MEEKKKVNAGLLIAIITIAVVIGMGLLVFFTFFFKNEHVRNTESAIDAIGTVTLSSGYAIDTADNLYNGLTDKEKSKVGNLSKLLQAKNVYKDLCDRDAAEKVDRLIDGIGEVTRKSERQINEARAAYDSLSRAQKNYVEKRSILEMAEEDFEYLDVGECEELISKIADAADSPDVQLPVALEEARKAYDALSYTHRKKVSNYDNLVKAEEAYEEYIKKKDEYKVRAEREARLNSIYDYRKNCQAVTYAQLISSPDSYKGKDISIKVDILSVDKAAFLSKGTIFAKPAKGLDINFISLLDDRAVKDPAIAPGSTFTIYGVFNGVKTITNYVKGSGLLGTDLFAKVNNKASVPEISVKYTSVDNEEAINSQPTTTEVLNSIEEGLEIAKDVTGIIKSIPW